ncbi:MAG: hypothetical protein R3Y22_00480 [Bacteroidales bacterium]
MSTISRFFSVILSPLLMPTYGVLVALSLTILCMIPSDAATIVTLVIFALTCVVPSLVVFTMKMLGFVSDYSISNRKQRPIPYLATISAFIVAALYINAVEAPQWLSLYFLAGAGAALTAFIINWWWKISAHLSGIGGLLALLVNLQYNELTLIDITPLIYIGIIATGMLGTARLYLNRHTFWQVIFGFLNGFLWVYLLK